MLAAAARARYLITSHRDAGETQDQSRKSRSAPGPRKFRGNIEPPRRDVLADTRALFPTIGQILIYGRRNSRAGISHRPTVGVNSDGNSLAVLDDVHARAALSACRVNVVIDFRGRHRGYSLAVVPQRTARLVSRITGDVADSADQFGIAVAAEPNGSDSLAEIGRNDDGGVVVIFIARISPALDRPEAATCDGAIRQFGTIAAGHHLNRFYPSIPVGHAAVLDVDPVPCGDQRPTRDEPAGADPLRAVPSGNEQRGVEPVWILIGILHLDTVVGAVNSLQYDLRILE